MIDTGIGLKSSDHKKIFTAFTQADTSTSRRYGGTGLGLVISQKLIEKMQGAIKVKSSVGEGSTFSFYIKTQHLEDQSTSSVHPMSRIAKLNIISFEHDPKHQANLNEMLSFGKINVTHCQHIEEFRKNLPLLNNFDVFLVSLDSPGVQQVEQLIQENAKKTAKVIFHSTDTTGNHFIHNNLLLLPKPIGHKKLYDELMKVLSDGTQYKQPTSIATLTEKNLTILVAEDNPINQFLFTSLLSKHNIKLTLVNDGAKAYEKAKDHRYDLIIVDLQMPVMDGIETAENISQQKDSLNRSTPIIAISANLSNTKKQTLKHAGIIGSLEKPFDEKKLIELIVQATTHESIKQTSMAAKAKSCIVDRDACLTSVSNNKKAAKELLFTFTHQLKEEQILIKHHYENGNFIALQSLVHKIHGASCFVGLPFLKDSLQSLEQALEKKASSTRIHALYLTLLTDIQEVLDVEVDKEI